MRPSLSILPATAAGVPPAYWTAELIRASPLKLVKLMTDTGTPPVLPLSRLQEGNAEPIRASPLYR